MSASTTQDDARFGGLQTEKAKRLHRLQELVSLIDRDKLGVEMFDLMSRLFPICRSITGDGVRETLAVLQEWIDLDVQEVPTGYQAFDWTVPKEWSIRDAYIKNRRGERVVDFQKSNLHVLNYSIPVAAKMSFEALRPHLYSKPELPDAIPHMTSYYEERWGFCLSQNQLDTMADDDYDILIDSSLSDGHLTYADSVIPGASEREVLISTYICHPSLANDNLSGPVLTAMLNRLLARCDLRYTYRFVYIPETIGALVYLSKNGERLRQNLDAGYIITCVGDDGPFTYKKSRRGDSAADKVAEHCLKHMAGENQVIIQEYFPMGSDERQYCSPGFNLPVGSLMRSMYGTYPEYHTSLDNMGFVSAQGMADSLIAYLRMVQVHELNRKYINLKPYGEPQLGKRGLVPTLGELYLKPEDETRQRYLLGYSDGTMDLVDIANQASQPAWEFAPEIESLTEAGLLGVAD